MPDENNTILGDIDRWGCLLLIGAIGTLLVVLIAVGRFLFP